MFFSGGPVPSSSIQPDRARDPNRLCSLRARGAGDCNLDASEYRSSLRLRSHRGRHVLLRHGIFAWFDAGRSWSSVMVRATSPARSYPSASVRCPDRGSCHRPDPPRYQTGQSSSSASEAGCTTWRNCSTSGSCRLWTWSRKSRRSPRKARLRARRPSCRPNRPQASRVWTAGAISTVWGLSRTFC